MPEKIKIGVWRCCWNAIPTRVNLMKRKVLSEVTCMFYDKDQETVEHALLQWSRTSAIWLSSALGLHTGTDLREGFIIG